MFFKEKKRCSKRKKEQYSAQVSEFLKGNSFAIVHKIYEFTSGKNSLNIEEVKKVLGTGYPVAPWVDETDIIGQFAAILDEAGYKLSYDKNEGICFKEQALYSAIVKNHLKLSGRRIVEYLSDECIHTGGTFTYFQLQRILGLHYPRAPYVDKNNTQACIILFLNELGIPFKFDSTYVYFP